MAPSHRPTCEAAHAHPGVNVNIVTPKGPGSFDPLSGMAQHPLAPRWHRLGRLLFSHGEHFYNFQGLRAFKEKFGHEWEARYLAAPGGMTPLFVLADVAALISGGMRGLIAK